MIALRLVVLCAAASLAAQTPDWKKVHPEVIEHFVALLKIDTSNPPGNETQAAEYVKAALAREGIESQLLGPNKDRLNLVARIRGNGSRKPILIMGHTDVVGVQREKWTVDPFGGIRKGGFIYGRGALDDKDNLAACLMTMILLKRLKTPLDRDVIFVAEAGEEGFAPEGMRFLVEKQWPDIEAEFALAEGGGGFMRGGEGVVVSVAATEKVGAGVTLVARGPAGHGSVPIPNNAIARLARAVARVSEWQAPMKLNDVTRAFFERLAAVSPQEKAKIYREVLDPRTAPAAEEYLRVHEPGLNSVLRTGISPTIIQGGFRGNVIPSEARANLDIRALPDEDLPRFYEMLRSVIGDPAVEMQVRGRRESPPPSRIDTEMFQALERAQKTVYPKAVTIPAMLTGGTDMQPLRLKGVPSYGIGPLREEGITTNGAHSDDERVSEAAFLKFVEFLWAAVIEVAGSRR
jgi:acetylornithine deacetylase/succinyl-diaminopimelate desuccinylase-like protein